MADGLSWLLELDAKLDGALKMVRALDQGDAALHKMDASLRKVESASQHASAGHQKHGAAVKHTEGLLHHFMKATLEPLAHRMERIAEFEFIRRGVDALIEAPMEALHLFKELAAEMINVAAKAERMEVSFKLMFGATEGKETLEWIEKISKFTEFTDDQLKGMAVGLAKAGFEGKNLTRALAASIDMAAFSGSGAEGGSAAVHALEMINLKGQANFRALRGMGIKEEDYMTALSKRLGMATSKGFVDAEGTVHKPFDALKKKIEAGQVKTDEMIETLYSLIAKRTGKNLGGAGVEMSKTLMARLTHLKDLPEQFFQKLAGTEGYAKISDFVGRLLTIFDPDGEIGTKISTMLSNVFGTVGDKLAGIDLEKILGNVPAAIDAITASLTKLWDIFHAIVGPILSGFGKLANMVEWINEKTGTGSWSKQAGTNAQFRIDNPALAAEGDRLRQLLREKRAGMQTGAGFTDGLRAMKFGAGAAGADVGGAAIDGLQKKLDIHSPSRVFERMGEMTGEGFNRGVARSMADTDNVVRGAFAIPAPAAASGLGGSISVEVGGIHLHVAGSTSQEITEQALDRLKEAAPGIFQSAIEHLAIQAGGT